MKQLSYLLLLSVTVLFSCQSDDDMRTESVPIERGIAFMLDTENCSRTWSSLPSAFLDEEKNAIILPLPSETSSINIFSTFELDENNQFGPVTFESYTKVFIELSEDTIFVEAERVGFASVDFCRSSYVRE